ncbi:MAG: oligosaccharide repeat unit polymerase [Erysipelotrichaceae bacterium]|nr:oligosaccharide repeat unit polymerase [Erysipelotrichaceae bacterium]
MLLKFIDAFGYVFTFAIINNFVSKKIKFKNYYYYIFPVIIFSMKVLMGSGRLELLRWGSFALIVSFILNQYKNGWKKSISSKYIRMAFILVPVVLVLFYFATNIIGRETSRTFFQYISTYAGGSIQHFNQYITDSSMVTETHFGAETFPGIYSFFSRLGLTTYSRSVHLEMRQLGVTQGNIYTFFRRPYHDFGLFGMCLMTFLVVFYFSNKYSSFKTKTLNGKTNYSIICYSYLFYWIVLSSIENYSIGIVAISTLFTLILFKLTYVFLFGCKLKNYKLVLRLNC